MKAPTYTYLAFNIHHEPGEGYIIQHPKFGDVWFQRLIEARRWIDGGCIPFGKIKELPASLSNLRNAFSVGRCLSDAV
jgi:hypothetical protein